MYSYEIPDTSLSLCLSLSLSLSPPSPSFSLSLSLSLSLHLLFPSSVRAAGSKEDETYQEAVSHQLFRNSFSCLTSLSTSAYEPRVKNLM